MSNGLQSVNRQEESGPEIANNMSVRTIQGPRLPITQQYRSSTCLRIAQHEVGHYIAARIMGFKPGAISITIIDLNGAHDASSELTTANALYDKQSILDFLHRRVVVLYSGVLAEALTKGSIDEKLAHINLTTRGGVRDYDKVRELLQLARNIEYPEAVEEPELQSGLTAISKRLWDQAVCLVEEECKIIEGLGLRLAMGVKYTNQPFILSESEIEIAPNIIKRFANTKSLTARESTE